MYRVVMKIASISLLMSFAEVFVIRWIRKLCGGIEFTPFQCAMIHICLALLLGMESYLIFNIVLINEGLSVHIVILFWFLILGFSQVIHDNYNKIEKILMQKVECAVKEAMTIKTQEIESREVKHRRKKKDEKD